MCAVKEGLQPAAPWPSQADQAMPEQNASAKAAWAQIQQRMKPPLCKGHSEPCVIRQVKKGGPNQGEPAALCTLGHMLLPCSCLCSCTRASCCCASCGSHKWDQDQNEDSTVQPDDATGAAILSSTCIKSADPTPDKAPDQPGAARSRCTFIASDLMVAPEGDGEPCIDSWPLTKLKRGHQGDLWPASSSCAAPLGAAAMSDRWETVSMSINAAQGASSLSAGARRATCRRGAATSSSGRATGSCAAAGPKAQPRASRSRGAGTEGASMQPQQGRV